VSTNRNNKSDGGVYWLPTDGAFTPPEQRPHAVCADGTTYTLPTLVEPQPDHEWRVIRHWDTTDALGKTKHLSWNVYGQLLAIVPMRKRCTTMIPTGACAKTSMPVASTLTIGMTLATPDRKPALGPLRHRIGPDPR